MKIIKSLFFLGLFLLSFPLPVLAQDTLDYVVAVVGKTIGNIINRIGKNCMFTMFRPSLSNGLHLDICWMTLLYIKISANCL